MAAVYVTQVGDALDMICKREYGKIKVSLPQVLSANPDIARFAQNLPPRTEVLLPDIKAPAAASEVRLWD